MSATRGASRVRGTTVLAYALFVVGLAGLALSSALSARSDPTIVTWQAPILLFGALTGVTGWLLAWKRPRIPIGWLMLAIGLLAALQGPALLVAQATRASAPLVAGWALEVAGKSSWTWIEIFGILFALVPLRFPNGRLPSPRWRWFWWTSIAVMAIASVLSSTIPSSMQLHVPSPTYVDWGRALPIVEAAAVVPFLAVLVGSLASLFVRYRRADAVERAQLRWLFWALAVAVSVFIVGVVESAATGDQDNALGSRIIGFLGDLGYCLIPLAILFAVLRSGLYAIDRIVSRTAAYAIVTLGIVVVYIGIVLLGSLLFPTLPSIGVAAATLAAAALFLPFLRAVRRRVDRRFNRAQYDAEKVVDEFGESVRTGADPHSAGGDFMAAVERALQPSAIGIWRREAS